MCRALRKCLIGTAGTMILLALSACTSRMNVPINDYSHISVETAPLDREFMVRYHLYGALPGVPVQDRSRRWSAEIKLDTLGTLYSTDESGSPAARRIEEGWEDLWLEGTPSWQTIQQIIAENDHKGDGAPRTPSPTGGSYQLPRSDLYLPIAELPYFSFSTRPEWVAGLL